MRGVRGLRLLALPKNVLNIEEGLKNGGILMSVNTRSEEDVKYFEHQ